MAKHNDVGATAEQVVCRYLESRGYKIIDRNWRSKLAEIDIVARKDDCIYFVEVKYRFDSLHGGGYDAINKNKLHKMRLGAESWVLSNKWTGECCLSVAEVSGSEFDVDLIEEIV